MAAVPSVPHGVSFRTDLSSVGRRSTAFGGSTTGNILDEERQLIDKVFSIVDRDNSGSVDMAEMKEMFKLFGVDSQYLQSAIQRVMANVDKDFDGMISPQEFYQLLSQKFSSQDSKRDIEAVFNRMDKNKDRMLDVEELYDVSQMLGEGIDKSEIRNIIKTFNRDYQERLRKWQQERKKNPDLKAPEDPKVLSLEDFYAVMQEEL